MALKMVKGSWQIASVVLYFCKNKLIGVRNLNDGNKRFHSTDWVKSLENSVLGKECILVLSKLDWILSHKLTIFINYTWVKDEQARDKPL